MLAVPETLVEDSVQAAVVPYRIRSGRVEVALITSSSGRRWIFPKGWIDEGETPAESARRESHEEAGLLGDVHDEPIALYAARKDAERTVAVYLMRVTRELSTWAEAGWRRRRWVEIDELLEWVGRGELKRVARRVIEVLEADS